MKSMLRKFLLAGVAALGLQTVSAQEVLVSELPTNIRFEQYTGAAGNMVFWRLPTPGSSTFPSSSCLHLIIPSDRAEHASRFMALYLFAKSNSKQIFFVYNTSTCIIKSFGMDG